MAPAQLPPNASGSASDHQLASPPPAQIDLFAPLALSQFPILQLPSSTPSDSRLATIPYDLILNNDPNQDGFLNSLDLQLASFGPSSLYPHLSPLSPLPPDSPDALSPQATVDALEKLLSAHILSLAPRPSDGPLPPPAALLHNQVLLDAATALLDAELAPPCLPESTDTQNIPLDPRLQAEGALAAQIARPSPPPPPKRTRGHTAPAHTPTPTSDAGCSIPDTLEAHRQPGRAKKRRPRRTRARRPSSSLSAILAAPGSPEPEASLDPNVHPALQGPRSPRRTRGTDGGPGLGCSPIDVHGAGAGGGAAAVLAAAAHGTQTELWGESARSDPVPTTYDPDQFRASQRIQWTASEEELLIKEVEMYYERYDCMAHIIRRHGRNGSISNRFADRSGVSLKDKAVNISSRWFRDGGGKKVSESLRRAFLRFRPKQMRGRSRSEVVAMVLGSSFGSGSSSGGGNLGGNLDGSGGKVGRELENV